MLVKSNMAVVWWSGEPDDSSSRPKQTKKFVLFPRLWVVENTFGWLNHSRRLSKSYERPTRTSETWIYIAMKRLML